MVVREAFSLQDNGPAQGLGEAVSNPIFGPSVPSFVAQASYPDLDDTGSEPIRLTQKALRDAGIARQGTDTDALRGVETIGPHVLTLVHQDHVANALLVGITTRRGGEAKVAFGQAVGFRETFSFEHHFTV